MAYTTYNSEAMAQGLNAIASIFAPQSASSRIEADLARRKGGLIDAQAMTERARPGLIAAQTNQANAGALAEQARAGLLDEQALTEANRRGLIDAQTAQAGAEAHRARAQAGLYEEQALTQENQRGLLDAQAEQAVATADSQRATAESTRSATGISESQYGAQGDIAAILAGNPDLSDPNVRAALAAATARTEGGLTENMSGTTAGSVFVDPSFVSPGDLGTMFVGAGNVDSYGQTRPGFEAEDQRTRDIAAAEQAGLDRRANMEDSRVRDVAQLEETGRNTRAATEEAGRNTRAGLTDARERELAAQRAELERQLAAAEAERDIALQRGDHAHAETLAIEAGALERELAEKQIASDQELAAAQIASDEAIAAGRNSTDLAVAENTNETRRDVAAANNASAETIATGRNNTDLSIAETQDRTERAMPGIEAAAAGPKDIPPLDVGRMNERVVEALIGDNGAFPNARPEDGLIGRLVQQATQEYRNTGDAQSAIANAIAGVTANDPWIGKTTLSAPETPAAPAGQPAPQPEAKPAQTATVGDQEVPIYELAEPAQVQPGQYAQIAGGLYFRQTDGTLYVMQNGDWTQAPE